jgi:hypothetical protein
VQTVYTSAQIALAAELGLIGGPLDLGEAAVAGEAAGELALTEYEIGSTLEKNLATAKQGKVSKAVQYLKSGGFDQANADFNALT